MKNPYEPSDYPQIVQTYSVSNCHCLGEDTKCPNCDGDGEVEVDLLAKAKAALEVL